MGKSNKVKQEYRDAVEMVDLIQTLKDIADNKYFTLTSKKDTFRRFTDTFVEFFRMVDKTEVVHPLLSNQNKTVGIVVVTGEGSFLGEFNNKIIRTAMTEYEKHEDCRFIGVGSLAKDRLEKYTPDIRIFTQMEERGMYKTAIEVKDYLVEEIMAGRLGKVILCYSWPKSFELHKPFVVQILPCEDLLPKTTRLPDTFDHIIEESDPQEVVGYLCNLWTSTRLYEVFLDTIIASASAQAKFLDDSVEKMKKERAKAKIKYRKAKKADIDKGLRETFSARMMVVDS